MGGVLFSMLSPRKRLAQQSWRFGGNHAHTHETLTASLHVYVRMVDGLYSAFLDHGLVKPLHHDRLTHLGSMAEEVSEKFR